jgi:hypothetical protein
MSRDLVTINDIATLKEFKNKLYIYYKTALDKCYDVDDPRTWKTVCLKCNQARGPYKADNVLFLDFNSFQK